MPLSRRLELVNESPLAGRMAVYLKDPEAGPGPSFPLAWRSLSCGPGQSVRLDWDEDFGLTSGAMVEPGLIFSGGEIQPIGSGGISFRLGRSASGYGLAPVAMAGDREPAGALEYVPEDIATGFVLSLKPGEKRPSLADLVRERPVAPAPSSCPDRIQVLADSDIPAMAVALCLDGAPAFLRPAEPGRSLSFPVRPRYGAVFGSFETGLVLDPDQMLLTTELDLSGGPLRAVFRRDCLWEVTPAGS
jgi:hypothetical protein